MGIVTLCALVSAPASRELRAQGTDPTFNRDIAPIVYANCTTCHRQGGIGPMSLLTYAGAQRAAARIAKAVSSGHMPPWHADAPKGTFSNDRRLSDADKAAILRWIEIGTPEGDAKDLPPAPVYTSDWSIPTPDAVVQMPEEFEVPEHGTIEYQYFEVPTNFTKDMWVQALEIMPGAREVVHHVLVFASTPAPAVKAPGKKEAPERQLLIFRQDQGLPDPGASADKPPIAGRDPGALIGTTAPGTNVQSFPMGTAMRIKAGSVLTFQVHYTAKGHVMKDRTKVGFVFAKRPPKQEIMATQFVNGMFTIPPGATDYPVTAELGINDSVQVWGIFPHTHLRGKKWQYKIVYADGRAEKILD
ncbi:MAG: cytochrome c, partial [Gemmatimonadaceae bacterium]